MTKSQTTEYRYVGDRPGDLADGHLLEPGRTYKLDAETAALPHNQRLIDDGLLLDTTTKKESD